jgi:hypothetical protein
MDGYWRARLEFAHDAEPPCFYLNPIDVSEEIRA